MMRRIAAPKLNAIVLCAVFFPLLGAVSQAQLVPQATELPGHPFYVKKVWRIGGEGNWDYLTLDAATSQLFVAHGTAVQVVDVSAGTVVGEIKGMRDAHGIALDDGGQFGYISDGGSNAVKVFDRKSLEIVASIPTGPNPRAIVYEPQTKLVFAVCAEPITDITGPVNRNGTGNGAGSGGNGSGGNGSGGNGSGGNGSGGNGSGQARRPGQAASGASAGTNPSASRTAGVRSAVTVIDTQTRAALTNLLLPGRLGFAQADGRGRVYINIVDRNQIAHFNAQGMQVQLATMQQAEAAEAQAAALADSINPGAAANSKTTVATKPAAVVKPKVSDTLDWTGAPNPGLPNGNRIRTFALGQSCQDPRGLAVDSNNGRLFTACDNRKMDVLNADTGEVIATLPIGPGTDAVGYDSQRGLIYTANGGGDGSVSIIRQHVSDSYALVQELPTFQRARTLAVNQQNGEVYLVTNKVGVNLKHEGGIGDLQMGAVEGSFEVLVISDDNN